MHGCGLLCKQEKKVFAFLLSPLEYLHPEFRARDSNTYGTGVQYPLNLLGCGNKATPDERQVQGYLRNGVGNDERWGDGEQIDLLIVNRLERRFQAG